MVLCLESQLRVSVLRLVRYVPSDGRESERGRVTRHRVGVDADGNSAACVAPAPEHWPRDL